jgi:SET domain-containing protein
MIADITVKEAGSKGLGVFALRNFRKDEFLFRRRHSRIVSTSDIPYLSEDDRRHLCELDFESSAILLPPGCFLNHSCDPNAMRSGVRVFAWKDIAEGDEITTDYRLNAFDDFDTSQCNCGTSKCPGEITWSFFELDEFTQRLYLPYAPRFIREEYRRRRRMSERSFSKQPHGPGG